MSLVCCAQGGRVASDGATAMLYVHTPRKDSLHKIDQGQEIPLQSLVLIGGLRGSKARFNNMKARVRRWHPNEHKPYIVHVDETGQALPLRLDNMSVFAWGSAEYVSVSLDDYGCIDAFWSIGEANPIAKKYMLREHKEALRDIEQGVMNDKESTEHMRAQVKALDYPKDYQSAKAMCGYPSVCARNKLVLEREESIATHFSERAYTLMRSLHTAEDGYDDERRMAVIGRCLHDAEGGFKAMQVALSAHRNTLVNLAMAAGMESVRAPMLAPKLICESIEYAWDGIGAWRV